MNNNFLVKKKPVSLFLLLFLTLIPATATAGLFGPPQTVSREAGGLNTAIGYLYHEDKYTNGADHVIRQNEIYSQAAYGSSNIWEIFARVGMADMKIFDIFVSPDASTTTDKNDFEENGKIFGTLGAKIFYPMNKTFGVGVFAQGTYYFKDFNDEVSGFSGGTPFRAELEVDNLWEVNCGIGIQATFPIGIKLYAGPYIYYSEARFSLSSDIPGLGYSAGNVSVENKSIAGGFAGLDIPLTRGFRLNIEGQFSDRFSAGAAISYTY